MTTRKQNYDESNIKRLRGLEGIRKRPGMYLGELGTHMVFQATKELIANAVDEFFAGRNSYVFVHADNTTGTYIVADKAEGIPVGLVPEDPSNPRSKKVSTMTLIFTEIHTGGKFDDKAYSVSQGTHGVGASATNAVSSTFEVWTHRDSKWHYQAFACGKPKAPVAQVRFPSDVKKLLPYNPTSGTIIRFSPDQSVVSVDHGKTKAKLDVAFTARWMRDMAMLNPGIELVLSSGGKTKSFLNKEGLTGIIRQRVKELEVETTGKPFTYTSDSMSIAFQWSSYSNDDGVATYVNSGITRDGGEHEVGVRNTLSKVLKPLSKKTDKYAPKDLYFGLLGIVNYKMSGAAFSGQTKDRLTSNVAALIEKELTPVLTAFFTKNKTLARSIIRRAVDVKKSKDEFKKTLDAVSNAKRKSKSNLPAALTQSPKALPSVREIYIVEGDSAAGCLHSETHILLSDGSTKTMAELAYDFQLGIDHRGIAYDRTNNKHIEFTFDHPRITKHTKELIEIELDDGSVVKCTPCHKWLLTNGTYKRADQLTDQDDLQIVQVNTLKKT